MNSGREDREKSPQKTVPGQRMAGGEDVNWRGLQCCLTASYLTYDWEVAILVSGLRIASLPGQRGGLVCCFVLFDLADRKSVV